MADNNQPVKYQRVMLKLSGEAFAGQDKQGINADAVREIAEEVATLHAMGIDIAVVIGGGNIVRGKQAAEKGVEQVQGHYMGMLATLVNSLALQDALEKREIETRVMSALTISAVAEPYIRRRAMRHLEKHRIVIFGGGTGNPYFTTDSAAALRASEINADVILMAKNGTDGIYDSDPRHNPNAKKFDTIEYADAINRQLKVMDLTAFTFCMENKMPIIVFDINFTGNMQRIVLGEKIGTLVS